MVSGYYVYRATGSGGPYTRITSTVVTGTAYVDSTIARGQTYFYAVTAVDAARVKSLFSNEATTAVP